MPDEHHGMYRSTVITGQHHARGCKVKGIKRTRLIFGHLERYMEILVLQLLPLRKSLSTLLAEPGPIFNLLPKAAGNMPTATFSR